MALPRLGGAAAKSAAEQLAHHEALLSGAASLSRLHCAAVPPREAGYVLDPAFLDSPAAGLGGLEAAALPVYGDLVALSEGETRQWAIAALLSAGKRAVLWGADTGALPGLDRASLARRRRRRRRRLRTGPVPGRTKLRLILVSLGILASLRSG